ncbi:MAG: DUF4139 domain-containing protein [Phycisphaeraceae bacterium]|nr:DUF4139 domain-containing protein [Phycisphaeraceae bacterium]
MTRTLTLMLGAGMGAGMLVSAALGQDTALTIYSYAAPGAVPPEMYRPVGQGGYGYGYNPYSALQVPGYAVVRQTREIDLPAGRSETTFDGVAALIEPTTVRFESLTDPDGTRVLEQNFRFDLFDLSKLLGRHLGSEVNVGGETVTLLAVNPQGMLVRNARGEIYFVQGFGSVRLSGELAEGLQVRPTLAWDVVAQRGGSHDTRVSYQTDGITWWADYNIVFSEGRTANTGELDVGAWVSILNQTGATYEDAKLKLVAGDVQRMQPQGYGGAYMPRSRQSYAGNEAMAAGFEEKAFFEYHLYTLGRPTTIPDNSTKQIELFEPAEGVAAEKVLLYYGLAEGYRSFLPNPATDRNYGTEMNKKVDVYLRFRNDEASGLGIPLPKGRIRVSKLDPADGSLEFIGEDVIDHTAKNERVLVKLGSAFDVVGERIQTNFNINSNQRWMTETIEIRLRNHKDERVSVIAKENLFRWVNWEITEKTHDFEKVDARTIHFPVTLDPEEEEIIRYTVRYTW